MKAIRYHGPTDMRYEDVDMPAAGPDDVLIKVKAAGLCGTILPRSSPHAHVLP